MELHQRILFYGLIAPMGLGIAGCNRISSEKEPVKPAPLYVSGVVKSEKYQKRFVDSNIYFFTLSTENGLKRFECYGDWSAPKMDSILDPKDRVKFKIPSHQIGWKNDFSVELEDIVEINGEPFSP